MVEFESSALIAVPTASEEASVSSSGEQLMISPAPPVATTAEKKKRNLPGMPGKSGPSSHPVFLTSIPVQFGSSRILLWRTSMIGIVHFAEPVEQNIRLNTLTRRTIILRLFFPCTNCFFLYSY